MADKFQFASIIIPCRNEENFIRECLDSIISNDYPKDYLEVLVFDGMSEDKTMEIIKEYSQRYSFIKIFENQKKIAPVAQNMGLKNSKGEIIMIMDAHTVYPKNYISKCIFFLNKYQADCVGGLLKSIPRTNTFIAKAIASAFSHPFAAGNAEYKKYGSKEPKLADNVPYGCFKREIFEKIGNWNENLYRSYDADFYSRLRGGGGKIILAPEILIYYYVRSALGDFWKHNFLDGVWVTYPLKFTKKIPFSRRHFIPLFFVSSLIISIILSFFMPIFLKIFLIIIGAYFLVNIYCSFSVSVKEKNPAYFFVLPIIFFIRHFAYGMGSVWGLIKMIK